MDLVYAPAEILKESTPPVNVNDSDLRLTFLQAKMMLRIMEQYNGVGLSASQVSIRKSFFIMGDANKAWVIINPRILEYSDDKVLLTEGCLSYPGLFLNVLRPETVTVEYANDKGKRVTGKLEGMISRVFQHEHDHTQGITYDTLVSKLKLSMARKKLLKRARTSKR